MSKRTTDSRSSPSPPHRYQKRQRRAKNDVSLVPDSLASYTTAHTTTISPPVISDHPMDVVSVNGKDQDTSIMSNSRTSLNDMLHSPKSQPPTHARVDSIDSAEWTKVDKRKEKKSKKEAQKVLTQPPRFAFNVPELVKMGTVSIAVSKFLPLLARPIYDIANKTFLSVIIGCS
jgi:hypothetical protein